MSTEKMRTSCFIFQFDFPQNSMHNLVALVRYQRVGSDAWRASNRGLPQVQPASFTKAKLMEQQNCEPQNSAALPVDGGIDTGDYIHHRPSGENWVVAYCRDGEVCCCGWPETFAKVSDCELTHKASPEKRMNLLEQMKNSRGSRGEHARYQLELAKAMREGK